MTKPFRELVEKLPKESQKRIKNKTRSLLAEMPLWELRQARSLTQERIAHELNIKQSAVSRLERRTDMYISSLREIIASMGGELEITAKFHDGSVKISQFAGLDKRGSS